MAYNEKNPNQPGVRSPNPDGDKQAENQPALKKPDEGQDPRKEQNRPRG